MIHKDDLGQIALRQAYLALLDSKPKERGELSRRYQITITELEKLMAYFDLFVVQRSFWPEENVPL